MYSAMCFVLVISSIPLLSSPAKAANFQSRTGTYIGTGASGNSVTGLGFTPDLVIIKSSGAFIGAFKTSAMPANTLAFLNTGINNTASAMSLDSNGFTLNANLNNINSVNILYHYTAYGGSDCSSTGNFCVGTYTGNGPAAATITTGFQPEVVAVKSAAGVGAHFRTASAAAGRAEYFSSTAASTNGAFINTFVANGFTVGSSDNTNGVVFNYFAFGGSNVAEGSFAGDGLDNRNITGLGFNPSTVFVKNTTSTTANNRRVVFLTNGHNGDHASFTADAVANTVNFIQAVIADGFQVGSGANTNQNGTTSVWFAMSGDTSRSASGTYSYKQGTYIGTGSAFSITGLGFRPDFVLLKGSDANFAVMRTRDMIGDNSRLLASTTTITTGAITSLDADGFSIGTEVSSNASGQTYQWQAFGGAYHDSANSGAADFAVGTFVGNGLDNRNMDLLPFQPDVLFIRSAGANFGSWRVAGMTGDLTASFTSIIESANLIQSLTTTGFQLGSSGGVNGAATVMYYVAFKFGPNLTGGTFTGNSVNGRLVALPSFRPDHVWLKRSTASPMFQRSESQADGATQYFVNTVNNTNKITQLNGGGFTVSNDPEVNQTGGTYRYVAWRQAPIGTFSTGIVDGAGANVPSPSVALSSVLFSFACTASSGTFGVPLQKVRIASLSGNAAWTTSIAATAGSTASWANAGLTQMFDYNDPSGSGCTDGADVDTRSGQLSVSPSGASITPEPVCQSTNLSLGSNQSFQEGVVNAITLVSAATGADTECYWDVQGIELNQSIPAEQASDNYQLNLTVTTTAA